MFVRCGNHGNSRDTGATFYHYGTADVRACYELGRRGTPQLVLDAAADEIKVIDRVAYADHQLNLAEATGCGPWQNC